MAIAVLAALLLATAGWIGRVANADPRSTTAPVLVPVPTAASADAAARSTRSPPPPSAASAPPLAGAPLSPLGQAQRRVQLALWQSRLDRAQHARDTYRTAAQYPPESRPIAEHPDRLRPFEPIAEDRELRMPGGSASQGMRLRTTQERVFASGLESSRITLTLLDDAGQTLPLRVTRAVQQEVTPPGATARTVPYTMPISDGGVQGDLVAGDGVFTAVMQPATQGFAAFAGTVRLELALDHAGQPGFIYFDLTYSPEQAATWLPGVREAVEDGSLVFHARAQVRMPGRYVVTARVDDATGKPVALTLFNGEVGTGTVEFRLPVFGKLLRDAQPAFPLTLRDIDGFLLKPDAYPDRVTLPRRAGTVHTSQTYPLAAFADAEWDSEERSRYLAELGRDVEEAQDKVRQLRP